MTYEPGRLQIRVTERAPRDLVGQVLGHLRDWCGAHWTVTVSKEAGDATLAEQDQQAEAARYAAAAQDPVVQAALAAFPGARIERVRPLPGGDAAEGADDDDGDTEEDP